MNHHLFLQDLAKFAAGLVAADFFSLVLYAQSGIFPVQFLGVQFTTDIVAPGVVFDIALFILLVHYGWHLGKIPRVRERGYLLIAGIVFAIVAAAHLWRVFTGVPFVLDGWTVPLWLSWFGVAVATYLAYSSFVFAGKLSHAKKR